MNRLHPLRIVTRRRKISQFLLWLLRNIQYSTIFPLFRVLPAILVHDFFALFIFYVLQKIYFKFYHCLAFHKRMMIIHVSSLLSFIIYFTLSLFSLYLLYPIRQQIIFIYRFLYFLDLSLYLYKSTWTSLNRNWKMDLIIWTLIYHLLFSFLSIKSSFIEDLNSSFYTVLALLSFYLLVMPDNVLMI